MPLFYRFVDPAYNLQGGSFPGTVGESTYGRINVTSGGIGGGDGSANADGATPSGGPNAGTLFVAFGEDATSLHFNRPARALAQNTDILDNILRGSIPRVERDSITLSTSSSTVAVTGDMFVGPYGMANTQSNINELVYLENADGTPIWISGQIVTCSLIQNGSGGNVLGTSEDGFYTAPTLSFPIPLPAGTYTLFCGRRTSYANMFEAKADALVAEHILGRAEDSLLWINFSHGLDGKYRKSSKRTGGGSVPDAGGLQDSDTPGSGSLINRDGASVSIVGVSHTWDETPNPYDDPLRAQLTTLPIANWFTGSAAYTNFDPTQSGNSGHVHVTTRRSYVEGTENGSNCRDVAATLVVNVVDLNANVATLNETSGSDVYYTYMCVRTPAVLNPGGAGGSYVQVNSPYFVQNDRANTGIALYQDIMLIEYSVSGVTYRRPYVAQSIVNATTLALSLLGGDSTSTASAPSFSANTSCYVTWLQVVDVVGGVSSNQGGSYSFGTNYNGFMHAAPGRNRAGAPDAGNADAGVGFFGRAVNSDVVASFGGFNPLSGVQQALATILANGDIVTYGGVTAIAGTLNTSGVTGTGNGTGYGVLGTGGTGSSANGAGVYGVGGGTSGDPNTGGTGVFGLGGPSSGMGGIGVKGQGYAGNVGGSFLGSGGSADIALTGTGTARSLGAPATPTAAQLNSIGASNVAKAWASYTIASTGTVTIQDGYNVASVALSGNTFTVTFASALASAHYAVVAPPMAVFNSTPTLVSYFMFTTDCVNNDSAKTMGGFTLYGFEVNSTSGGAVANNITTASIIAGQHAFGSFVVFGNQPTG
jgi:hypothetical protein